MSPDAGAGGGLRGRLARLGRRGATPAVVRTSPEQAAARAGSGAYGPPLEGPLRVGYVVWDWPALSQTFVLSEIQQLQSLGHDVVVYFKVDAEVAAEVGFDVVVRRVADADGLAAAITADGRQVMHTPFAYPGAARLVWPAAEATGVPFTFMAGGVDVAHYENIKRNRVGEVASSTHCLGVITLGRFHRDLLMECGVPSRRIVMERQSAVIPDLVERSQRSGRPVVVSVARFIEKKGLEHLVRAAVELPEVDVVIHGYGPLEQPLRELAASLGATNVSFPGPLRSQAELDAAYGGADLFALPCVRAADGDLDGLPTVLLEAMGSGLPVVTTTVANIPDLVIDGTTGFLAQPRDVPSLVAAIRRGLSLDDERRRSLVATARRHAVAYAGAGRTTETLLRLWRRTALDVVLVTCEGAPGSVDVVDRVLRLTSLPVTVTVVDDAGDDDAVAALQDGLRGREDVQVLALDRSVGRSAALGLGAATGRARYVVVLDPARGLVLRHGWDHQLVRVLQRTGASLAGRLVRDGDRPQVHDGLVVLERSALDALAGAGGLPPDGADPLELSRRVRAAGRTVDGVPGLASADDDAVLALVDEFTVAVHPASPGSAALLDDLVERRVRLCPVCRWTGTAFGADGACPGCGSSPFSRSAWRVVAQAGALPVDGEALVLAREGSLARALGAGPGASVVVAASAQEADAALAAALQQRPPALVVVDRYEGEDARATSLARLAADGGVVVMGARSGAADAVVGALRAQGLPVQRVDLVSEVCGFDTGALVVVGLAWDGVASQGTEV